MKARKTWREKMITPTLPAVVPILPSARSRWRGGTKLVPSAMEVEAFMREIPEGSIATLSEMRNCLAERHNADTTCPLLAGMFVRIAAEAGEEDARNGVPNRTPYWRVVKDDGALNPKLPGGVERQAQMLRREGWRILAGKGKKPPAVVLKDRGREPIAHTSKRSTMFVSA